MVASQVVSDEIKTPEMKPVYGWFAIVTVILLWCVTPVLARFLASAGFNSIEQSCFRYIFSTVFLWLYVLVMLRKPFRAYRPAWGALTIASILILLYQIAWVSAVYFISPTMTHLLLKMNIITGAIIAYVWEHTERDLIRSPRFLAGAFLGLLGAVGLVLGGQGNPIGMGTMLPGWEGYVAGVGLCLLAAFTWPMYSLFAKRLSRETHPMVIYSYIGSAVTAGLFVIVLITGDISKFFHATLMVQALVALSGIVCMAIAHGIYMIALRHLGVAVCMLGLLSGPLFTYILSYFVFHETLTVWQWVFSIPLLLGCGLAMLRKRNVG